MARPIRLNAHPVGISLEELMGAQIVNILRTHCPDTEQVQVVIRKVQDSFLLEVEGADNPSTPKSLVPVYSVHKKDPPPVYSHMLPGYDVRRLDPSKRTPVDDRGGPRVANFKNEADAYEYANKKNAQAHTEVPPPRFYVNNYGSSWAVFDNERKGMPRSEQYIGLFKHNARDAADEYAEFLNDKVK